MNAILLAAGRGKRLGEEYAGLPKCLLEFEGETLLQRHLSILADSGIESLTICTGYNAPRIHAAVDSYRVKPRVEFTHNPDYEQGSVLTLWHAREAMTRGDDVILMDADVLYGKEMLVRLRDSTHENCFLMDRDFESGEEPVKLCARNGRLCEFRKQIEGEFDVCGESVGFFRFAPYMAGLLCDKVEEYIDSKRGFESHEEALRDVLLLRPGEFGYEDVTGLPWTEIDFPEDILRAKNEILPQLL